MVKLDNLKFQKAQWKFIISSMIAYMFFYLTRKNLSMAQPIMLDEGVISKYALGTIMTVHGVLIGMCLFLFAWNASATGYGKDR